MSRLTLALASGLHLGTSLSADDANSLVQMPIAAHDHQADECLLPNGFADWQLCGKTYDNTFHEPGSTPTARRHNPNTQGYIMSEGRLKYEQVVVDGDETLDLVITVADGSTFECFHPADNGKGSGGVDSCFGQLNVMTGKSAVFDFAFKKANGDPHTVKNFMFTIYDVDQQGDDDREFIEYVDPPYRYWTSNDTDHNVPSNIIRDEETWRFESKGRGLGSGDNPNNYEDVRTDANRRSKIIAAQYTNMASFKVRLGHDTPLSSGRKFLFGGRVPNFVCPDPLPTTTPAPVCPDFKEATMNWKICEDHNRPKMPKSNNLGGAGPYTQHHQELRYENVTRYGGEELDLVVVNATTYTPFRVNRNIDNDDTNDGGASGCFGVINVKSNTSVDLDFKFVYNGQDRGPTFDANDKFVFSFWDIDHSEGPGHLERITIPTAHLQGDLHIGSNVDVSRGANEVVMTSKVFGNGSDNPTDDLIAGSEGATKRAAMIISGTNTWRVTLEAQGGKGGRNFMFYGCRSEEPTHPVP